jgi:hypothetical protein
MVGFVQQLASNYLPHGYWFYVTGVVPEGKDPRSVDRKLIEKYGIGISRQSRARRKTAGRANLHYLRFERFFVLLATHGQHAFFAEEGNRVRDVRRIPIQFYGYSLSAKKGHFIQKQSMDEPPMRDSRYRVRVQIARDRYRELKSYFQEMSTRHSVEIVSRELWCVPFEPYAPVRRQMHNILRVLNKRRYAAGLVRLAPSVLRYHRRIVRPFEPIHGSTLHESSAPDEAICADDAQCGCTQRG